MKSSIRTKFTMGMIFLFVIILILSVFSGYYMNKLSDKTGAILKENYLSVVYAREISEGIIKINQEITGSFLEKRNSDSKLIQNQLRIIDEALKMEKNNITESGEGKLVSDIEFGLKEYSDTLSALIQKSFSVTQSATLLYMQNKSGVLQQELVVLSQMNGNAIEVKTDEAKQASKSALTQMSLLGTLCFLIAIVFTFSFASYFNQRFFQLFNGIKEIVSSNYDQRLFFTGKDEFYEISLVFNEMAEKLKRNQKEMSLTLQDDVKKELFSNEINEVKTALLRLKNLEEQTAELLARLEKSK